MGRRLSLGTLYKTDWHLDWMTVAIWVVGLAPWLAFVWWFHP